MVRNRESQPSGLLGVIVLAILSSAWLTTTGPQAALASTLRRSPIVEAIARAQPAVVNIQGRKVVRAEPESGGGDPFRQVNGMGTGIILDARGYILTNFHVVENVEVIQVTLADKRGFVASLVSNDPQSDLAVIKIESDSPLPVMPMGISSDLMLGETVIAVGNAFGYENTVTDGIISALHREVQVSATQKYHDLIQTDASINPGNSGGPLLNIDGEMIGINVAVRVGAQGIGFAIPVDEVLEIAARLFNTERIDQVVHGILGETQSTGTERQFIVKAVGDGSPAESSGLKPGDIVATVDQTPIKRSLDLERALLGRETGQPVALSIRRDGQPQTLELVLAPSSLLTDEFDQRTWEVFGVKLSPAAREECQRLQTRYRGGMRVVAVRPDGPATRQGIRPGDILVGMHIWETISRDNVQYVLNHAEFEKFQPLKFFILRGAETLYGHMPLKREPVVQVSRRQERE